MKKTLIYIILFLFTGLAASAQAPQLFNYQGVARSTAGAPLVSQPIGLRLTILNDSVSGAVEYQETHTVTTNAFGLYNVAVGGGTVVSGTFASINWASGSKYMQVEIDPTGGTSYVIAGTSQLLSVPYAVYADNAGSASVLTGTVTMSGDVTGSNNTASVIKLQGKDISVTPPAQGQILTWDTTTHSWTPENAASAVTFVRAGTGLSGGIITDTGTISLPSVGTAGNYGSATQVPVFSTDAEGRVISATNIVISGTTPGGTAGGDLVGTYPNPTLATDGVTPGSYGTSTAVATFTVDAKGRVTTVSNIPIIGTTPGGTAGGDLTGTYPNPTFTTTGVTAGSYGTATAVPTFSVDSKGRVLSASSIAITGTTPGGTAGGDLAGLFPNPTLTTTGVTPGSYGTSTAVPTFTVDAKGRVINASSIAISGVVPGGTAGGDLTGLYPNPTLSTTGVTAGSYGTATAVPTFNVDSKGRVISASNIAISGITPGGSAGGDLTGLYPNPTLTTTGVTPGSYGTATAVPTFTVDAKGRVINASSIGISGVVPGGTAGGDLTGLYPSPTLSTTGVTAGSYGTATAVPTFSVDSKGRVISAGNIAISGITPGGTAGGDLTGLFPNPTLTTTGVTPGSYGTATAVPTFTVDAKGRVITLPVLASVVLHPAVQQVAILRACILTPH